MTFGLPRISLTHLCSPHFNTTLQLCQEGFATRRPKDCQEQKKTTNWCTHQATCPTKPRGWSRVAWVTNGDCSNIIGISARKVEADSLQPEE